MRDLHIQNLFRTAYVLFPVFLALHEEVLGDRKGVYLGIREIGKTISDPIEGAIIGEIPQLKIEEKKNFVFEKINRMTANNEYCSFASEDRGLKQFGGGIRATRYYLAASGFLPHHDQKFTLMVCLIADEVNLHSYTQIKNSSSRKITAWKKENNEKVGTIWHDF